MGTSAGGCCFSRAGVTTGCGVTGRNSTGADLRWLLSTFIIYPVIIFLSSFKQIRKTSEDLTAYLRGSSPDTLYISSLNSLDSDYVRGAQAVFGSSEQRKRGPVWLNFPAWLQKRLCKGHAYGQRQRECYKNDPDRPALFSVFLSCCFYGADTPSWPLSGSSASFFYQRNEAIVGFAHVCGPARPALVIREKVINGAYAVPHLPAVPVQYASWPRLWFPECQGATVRARLWLQLVKEAIGFFLQLVFRGVKC